MIDEIDSEEIHDFLAQSGVKGMRWGVRKARSSGTTTSKKPKTPEQKKATRDKVLKAVEIAGVVGMGAIAATYLVKRHQKVKMKQISSMQSNLAQVKRITEQNKQVHLQDINKLFREGKISSESGWKLSGGLDRGTVAAQVRKSKAVAAEVAAKQNMTTRAANKQLKEWFEAAQVPLHAREYLSG